MDKPDMKILSFMFYLLIILSVFAFVEERDFLAISSPSSGDEGKAFFTVNEGESQSENSLYDNEPIYESQNTGVPTSGLIDPEKGKDVPGPSYIISLAVFGLAYCLKISKK
ncbi:MAG: hypothetical protein NHB15_16505 [Methanosarcina barkeri]|nr:hypothetical protein [Methanosarcina sp. ERenArc_MAG2]